MIVALGTSHTKTKKDLTGHIGHFIKDQFPLHACIALVPFIYAMTKKTGGYHVIKVLWIDLVTSELFTDKLIVGFVLI